MMRRNLVTTEDLRCVLGRTGIMLRLAATAFMLFLCFTVHSGYAVPSIVSGGNDEFVCKDLSELERLAEQGNAAAQSNLGFMYIKGLGVAKDVHKALKWLQKAAEQGEANAQKGLDVMAKKGNESAKKALERIK